MVPVGGIATRAFTTQTVAVRAFAIAALLGLIQVGLAESAGITRFHQGYCCGGERDVLTSYANVVWFAAIAVVAGTLLAMMPVIRTGPLHREARASMSPAATTRAVMSRAVIAAFGALGAAVALPLVGWIAGTAPAGSDGDLSPGRMMWAYAIGLVFGLAVALLVAASPAYRSPVPLGIIVTTGVYWLVALVAAIGSAPLRVPPGGYRLIRTGFGALPIILVGLLCGYLAAVVARRLRTAARDTRSLLVVIATSLLLFALVLATLKLPSIPGRIFAYSSGVPMSTGIMYGLIGVGVAFGLSDRASHRLWLPVTAAAGFVIVAMALRLTVTFGPQLSGDGALDAGYYDIAAGIGVAVIGGVLIGIRHSPDRVPQSEPTALPDR